MLLRKHEDFLHRVMFSYDSFDFKWKRAYRGVRISLRDISDATRLSNNDLFLCYILTESLRGLIFLIDLFAIDLNISLNRSMVVFENDVAMKVYHDEGNIFSQNKHIYPKIL